MPEIIETTVYRLDELSGEAKQRHVAQQALHVVPLRLFIVEHRERLAPALCLEAQQIHRVVVLKRSWSPVTHGASLR